MTEEIVKNKNLAVALERFPAGGEVDNVKTDNPAIIIFGRRFHNLQTSVEYLAEFLLVFASPKNENGEGGCQFNLYCDENDTPRYWPEDRLALKLFTFFPFSKLETRHPVHRQAYLDAIEILKKHIQGTEKEKEETVRLIQSLLNGFVGVAQNRTWATHCFLPASSEFLSREINWEHSGNNGALKGKKGEVIDWDSSKAYFADNSRNFMGRGGQVLYLQILNFLTHISSPDIQKMLALEEYHHLKYRVDELNSHLTSGLKILLEESLGNLGSLVTLVEKALIDYKINPKLKSSTLGWVPAISRTEGALFAMEMDNICSSKLGLLDKLELLQTLCCMQVLRSLCFQACRVDKSEKTTEGFIGNYVWIVTDSEAKPGTPIRQMAQDSFNRVDALLYRVLRISSVFKNTQPKDSDLKNGDDIVFKQFRKLSKEIGLVIPKKSSGQRFTLHQGLLRFLVAALVCPGERIRLNQFYQRVFAHYGIALGREQLAVALNWCGNEVDAESYSVTANTAWIEEALQQGGFLVELSDAVSMVKNPG